MAKTLLKDGYWGGWREYRYGGRSQKPVNLPRLFKGNRKKHVLSELGTIMGDWVMTPFENEGRMRAAIRSSLCLAGHRWDRSDREAELLVAEILRRMGAQRPSWLEGQPHYTATPDRCAWCEGPIEDADIRPGKRFCSAECARNVMVNRYRRDVAQRDKVFRAAERLIQKGKAKPVPCAYCGTLFQSEVSGATYCSRACNGKDHERRRKWWDNTYVKNCVECGKEFSSSSPIAKFCCVAHSAKFFRWKNRPTERRDLARENLTCECCGSVFVPTQTRQIYCGQSCSHKMAKRAYYARKVSKVRKSAEIIVLTPAMFDSWFRRAAA